MPIFTDKGNEKRFITFLIIVISVIIIFIFYQVGCNKRPIKVGNIELSQSQVEEKRQDVIDLKEEYSKQRKVIDEISKEDLPRILKDSLALLDFIRVKDINEAEELINEFEQFNSLSYDEQVLLMTKTLNYLSKKVYPDRFKDYGEIAKSIVTTNKINILVKDTLRKYSELEEFKKQVAKLTKDNKILSLLYRKADSIIKQNEIDLLVYRKDSIKNAKLINTLTSQNDILFGEKNKLQNDLNNQIPINISYCTFTSPGCRSKKDGSYIVSCMNSLELRFTVKYDSPLENGKNEDLRIVFTLPTDNPTKNFIKEIKINANIGQENITNFKDQSYKFVPGLYTVQIFYDKTSTIIPIDIKSLSAKRSLL